MSSIGFMCVTKKPFQTAAFNKRCFLVSQTAAVCHHLKQVTVCNGGKHGPILQFCKDQSQQLKGVSE